MLQSRSWFSPFLSIAGVMFALSITGTALNVASFVGLIMVIGIVAKTAFFCWMPMNVAVVSLFEKR